MASVRRFLLQSFLYLTLACLLFPIALVASTPPTSLPRCPEKCGDITIPYPFGTGPGCYRDGFDITCNEFTSPPKPFFRKTNIEIFDINITAAEARVLTLISYTCYNMTSWVNYSNGGLNIKNETAFMFSNRRNMFTAIGCNSLAYIMNPSDHQFNSKQGNQAYTSGCLSFCENLNSTTGDGGLCNGLGCCQTPIPKGLRYYEVWWGYGHNNAWSFNPCTYAILVEKEWYTFMVKDLAAGFGFYERNEKEVPIVLDWAIRESGICLESHVESSISPACQSKHSGCDNTTNGEGYICKCLPGYEGNPYLPNGCTDINECQSPDVYPCVGTCSNTEGNYTCACPKGTEGDGKTLNCNKISETFSKPARVAICSILGILVLMGLCFLVSTHQQHKRHIKEKEEHKKYYQMMDKHLRVFSKRQIEFATNGFDETHVLGAGGQGKVYKGFLENNQIVAIKKAKEVEEMQRGEFVNEILLLSQINHKNIVRLLGCCLEVKIPMLVYEFVPNGTLCEFLHGNNKTRPISLGTRLKIALESAEALDYLHSSVSQTILHGDVKSANILLDIDYHAKVSDFGASNLVPIDDTQVVKVVQGTRGYLDPEYVATAVLTKKSDVYSFGVVLLELITRKCAIFRDENGERIHLASCFVSNANRNKLHDLLDKDIITTDYNVIIEVLHEASELAVWCLSVRGEDRPTMRQVVEKLQNLVRLRSNLLGLEIVPEEMQSLLSKSTSYITSDSLSKSTSYITSDSSAFHSIGCSSVLEIDSRLPR